MQHAKELFMSNRVGIKESDRVTTTPRKTKICEINEGRILIKIMLMLGEIEIEKKNFEEAYQYVKSSIFLLKSITDGTHCIKQEIEKIAHFLSEIEKQYVESIELSKKTIERLDFTNKLTDPLK